MKRRELLGFFVGAAAAWPLPVKAQERERRRVGVLMNQAKGDPVAEARLDAFVQGLQRLGWTEGANLEMEVRWGAPDPDRFRKDATELVITKPDVILATSGATMPALLQATRTLPIVFVLVPDPVGSGFVENLARPGGNATGFTQFDFGLSAKWLELLKELAPSVTRAAILRDPDDPAGTGQFGALRTAAPSLGIEVRPIDVRDPDGIERGVKAFATAANGGLVVTGSAPAGANRELIISLASRHRLPAVYPYRHFATAGGLISYGPDLIDQYRRAASYVVRILKGENPAELPVQAPTKYEMAINLRTAKALGLTVPPALLARADEVIE
jgi:putative ABC transport system substrate-binding protein